MSENSYASEAKDRWGDTDAYKESQQRMSKYSKEDIVKAQQAMQEATDLVLKAMLAGFSADSPEAMAGAEAHRQSISDWWYQCSYEIHTGLATMYLADPRFTAHYEGQHAGFAKYIHDSIVANAAKNA
jgi:hypothetical protein